MRCFSLRGGRYWTRFHSLRAQGHWTEVEITQGQKVPYFRMPTPELQSEFNDELAKKILKDVKAGGYKRVCAPQYDHPFHSDVLRERVASLAQMNVNVGPNPRYPFNPKLWSEQGVVALRKERKQYGYPNRATEEFIEGSLKTFRIVWSLGFNNTYRDMRRNPGYWRRTYNYQIIFPSDGPPLPDGPPPKPVYVNKDKPDLLLALRDGFVDLWTKRSLSA